MKRLSLPCVSNGCCKVAALLVVMAIGLSAQAGIKFSNTASSGQTVWFEIENLNSTYATVVYPGDGSMGGYYDGFTAPAGVLVIPATATYSGNTYPVTTIGGSAFHWCDSLVSVVLPSSITAINAYAFAQCYSLQSVDLGGTVDSLGASVFSDDTALVSVTGVQSLRIIGSAAFINCSALPSIDFLPREVHAIYNGAFSDCSSLVAVTLPDSLTTISNNMLKNCSALMAVVVPEGVTAIGNSAFRNCTSLTTVVLPNSVSTIGQYAFSGCTTLPSITIPASVTSIGASAFALCNNMNTIISRATTPPTIANVSAFSGRYNVALLYPPCDAVAAYQAANIWSQFTHIQCGIVADVRPDNPLMGQTTGGGVYASDTIITLTAIPATGALFDSWSNGVLDNPYTLHLTNDTTVLALFIVDTTAPEPPASREPFKYWVSFTDKQGSPYSLDNPSAYLSQRALERRARHGIAVDSLDLPVTPDYLQAVAATGADIRYSSRWLNGLMAYLPADQSADSIAALPFVAEVSCIDSIGTVDSLRAMGAGSDPIPYTWTEPYSEEWYGYSYTQIKMHNAAAMHSAGYTGRGVLIGVLDGGFYSAETNSVMQRARENGHIVATRNFVNPAASIYEDTATHGSNVLNFMGAYAPGFVIGTAMDAHFALCMTEDWRIENVAEEYHMVAALEFLDSLGADIVNASLGYNDFVPYDQRDGQTEVASIAGNIAAAKGLAFVVAAGNSGATHDPHIAVPADAEHVFTVGAAKADSTAAYFTSIGPTADGRIKPDAASFGQNVRLAQYDGLFSVGSGTSYATPILCGLMACVIQQHPEYLPDQLFDTIRSWGHLADSPSYELGYGIPDFSLSLRNLTGIQSPLSTLHSPLEIYPNPTTDRLTVTGLSDGATLQIFDMCGRMVGISAAPASSGADSGTTMLDVSSLAPGVYLLQAVGSQTTTTAKFIKR